MNSKPQRSSPRIVILCAVDGTDASDDVLRTAATLGQTLAAELHLVHVVEPAPDPGADVALVGGLTELVEGARHRMERDTARARQSFDGHIVGHVAAGTPWRAILQLATDLEADLIVVGSHRKGPVERWILGAVSEQVVRKASCAVLVARPKEYASAVPEIEPPCAECVAMRAETSGAKLWCDRHEHSRKHLRGHVHYAHPQSFAVGSQLIRPEG
jgi:nucleotide-binding universal stress UspA family protein